MPLRISNEPLSSANPPKGQTALDDYLFDSVLHDDPPTVSADEVRGLAAFKGKEHSPHLRWTLEDLYRNKINIFFGSRQDAMTADLLLRRKDHAIWEVRPPILDKTTLDSAHAECHAAPHPRQVSGTGWYIELQVKLGDGALKETTRVNDGKRVIGW